MASSQPNLTALRSAGAAGLHLHIEADVCPVCEQPIPHDRVDTIAVRLELLEREQQAEIAAKLETQFAAEKAALLDQTAREAAERVRAAREEARVAAEAESKAKVESAERAKQKAEAAVAQVKAEAATKEEAIRADAQRVAQEAAQAKIATAEAEKAAAAEASQALEAKLADAQRQHTAKIDEMQQDAIFREAEIRREATEATATAAREAIAEIERGKTEAETRAAAAQAQAEALQQSFDSRLAEQREALESAKSAAVSEAKAAHYDEKLKLSEKVESLQRSLEKKTADELGEGAHINLLDALKAEFEEDRIERVGRGLPGADILHTVMHNGKACGIIIYDSKNHDAWRNDFVTKLRTDQMAAKAEHAVLATRKFPAGEHQLHMQEGVIVASPARVVVLIQLLRKHMIQTHALRMSAEERSQKTAALYDYITSERCADLLARFDAHAESLLTLQDKEKRAHDAVWKQQGLLIRSVQKVSAELGQEIETIIGTGPGTESDQ